MMNTFCPNLRREGSRRSTEMRRNEGKRWGSRAESYHQPLSHYYRAFLTPTWQHRGKERMGGCLQWFPQLLRLILWLAKVRPRNSMNGTNLHPRWLKHQRTECVWMWSQVHAWKRLLIGPATLQRFCTTTRAAVNPYNISGDLDESFRQLIWSTQNNWSRLCVGRKRLGSGPESAQSKLMFVIF